MAVKQEHQMRQLAQNFTVVNSLMVNNGSSVAFEAKWREIIKVTDVLHSFFPTSSYLFLVRIDSEAKSYEDLIYLLMHN